MGLLLAADEDDRLRLGDGDVDREIVEEAERLDEGDDDAVTDEDDETVVDDNTHVELLSLQTPLAHSKSLLQEPSALRLFAGSSRRKTGKAAGTSDDGDGDVANE
jgi:predicted AAA+ superfamily ATPase